MIPEFYVGLVINVTDLAFTLAAAFLFAGAWIEWRRAKRVADGVQMSLDQLSEALRQVREGER